ncbi:hypothetical protein AYO44_11350 [Planctomycetaceae bacterium SCGC AG-212-F19]|nr:hypothetical protein AYO44_11350 [Planctomycetaceae bacterium SCGC AG-212-F19]
MAVYGRAHLHDLGTAVEAIPAILPGTEERHALPATSTDGDCLRSACATDDESCKPMRAGEETSLPMPVGIAQQKTSALQGFAEECNGVMTGDESSP